MNYLTVCVIYLTQQSVTINPKLSHQVTELTVDCRRWGLQEGLHALLSDQMKKLTETGSENPSGATAMSLKLGTQIRHTGRQWGEHNLSGVPNILFK